MALFLFEAGWRYPADEVDANGVYIKFIKPIKNPKGIQTTTCHKVWIRKYIIINMMKNKK